MAKNDAQYVIYIYMYIYIYNFLYIYITSRASDKDGKAYISGIFMTNWNWHGQYFQNYPE